MDSYDVILVGAGIAGAATAWHLAQAGGRRVLLLERDAAPGGRSTGRNAAILRTAIDDPALHALAWESGAFYRQPPPGFAPVPLIDPVGLVLAAPAAHADALRAWVTVPSHAQGGEEADVAELYRGHPYLARDLVAAWRFAEEGTLDVAAIHAGFLRGARAGGVELRCGVEVESLLLEDGALVGVHTAAGALRAPQVVLGGGGWADLPARAAGFPLPLQPRRRHLLVTPPDASIDPRAPVVWLQGEEFYFRPESGGMLMSACDHTLVEPDQGERSDESVLERIAASAGRWLPGLEDVGVAHLWAGMRTFADDGGFVLGADPRLEGLHWAAALGGHGISCAYAVGARVTAGLSGREARPELAPFALSRCLAAADSSEPPAVPGLP